MLGLWDVDTMLAQMTWQQLCGWMAYSELEPFGEERADLRMGITCATIANVNRDRKRKPTPYKASDFMPDFGGVRSSSRKPLTESGDWDRFMAQARLYAGTVAAEEPN